MESLSHSSWYRHGVRNQGNKLKAANHFTFTVNIMNEYLVVVS